jgi:protein-tyrosine phosphatase
VNKGGTEARLRGFVDLHCHWLAGIDDGAPSEEEGFAMLETLYALGFSTVVATPHMRPGMFDNSREDLVSAFARMEPGVKARSSVPDVALSSEHYFDDVVYGRLLAGAALPYPGGRAVLLEFWGNEFPNIVVHRLFDLRQRGLLPVIAHPERYRCFWRSPDALERLVDSGVAALLDTAALVGKYGREPKKSAEELFERGLYHAACSDAHRTADVALVEQGMQVIERSYGEDEIEFLYGRGPKAILAGERAE